ncbi:unnamed protein product [Lepidochelys kempii]
MPLRSRLYSVFFRRTSAFALTVALGALLFERAFDQGADAFYERLNRGANCGNTSSTSMRPKKNEVRAAGAVQGCLYPLVQTLQLPDTSYQE